MATKTWMTAAGVVGTVVIGGSALVAVATTGPSDTAATSAAPGASATASPEGTPDSGGIPDPTPSSTSTPSSSPTPSQGDLTGASGSGRPPVTSAEAVEIARAELGLESDAVTLEEIDLEWEDGRQIWDVEFAGDHEVEVDSTTGEVVKVDVGDGRDDRGDDDDGDDSGRGRGSDDGPNHD
jgi:Peptidase propeptide and YPEB domain